MVDESRGRHMLSWMLCCVVGTEGWFKQAKKNIPINNTKRQQVDAGRWTQDADNAPPTPTPWTQTDAHERPENEPASEHAEKTANYLKNFREMVTVTLTRDPNSLMMKNTNSWPMPAQAQNAATFLMTCFRCGRSEAG